ncbi:MAG: hypothetical protein ACP5OP_07480 [Leptospirillia bacterium]
MAGALLTGCGTTHVPPPNPFAGKGFFSDFADREGSLRQEREKSNSGGRSREASRLPLDRSFCAGTSLSRDGRRLSFRMVGTGQGGESDAPDAVLRLARQAALRRAMDCGGQRQIVRSFFDNVYHIGDREGQVLEQDLVETLAAFSRYEERSPSCRIAGSRLTCRVVLVGELRLEESDPSFEISGITLPRGGVLPAGSVLRMALRVQVPGTEPVRLYLFDVDRQGQGVLLYPLPSRAEGPIPGNRLVTIPPSGSREKFIVALPPGASRTVERLFVIVLRKGRLDVPVVATSAGQGGVYYRIPDFRKNVLRRLFRLRGAGSLWTLREVPFEIVPKSAEGSDPPAAIPMVDSVDINRQRSNP